MKKYELANYVRISINNKMNELYINVNNYNEFDKVLNELRNIYKHYPEYFKSEDVLEINRFKGVNKNYSKKSSPYFIESKYSYSQKIKEDIAINASNKSILNELKNKNYSIEYLFFKLSKLGFKDSIISCDLNEVIKKGIISVKEKSEERELIIKFLVSKKVSEGNIMCTYIFINQVEILGNEVYEVDKPITVFKEKELVKVNYNSDNKINTIIASNINKTFTKRDEIFIKRDELYIKGDYVHIIMGSDCGTCKFREDCIRKSKVNSKCNEYRKGAAVKDYRYWG